MANQNPKNLVNQSRAKQKKNNTHRITLAKNQRMHNTDTMFVEFASYQYLWSAKCYLTQVIFRILCAHRTQLFRLFAILDVYTLDLRRFDFAPRFKCQMFVRGVYSYAWCLCAAYISCVCVCVLVCLVNGQKLISKLFLVCSRKRMLELLHDTWEIENYIIAYCATYSVCGS